MPTPPFQPYAKMIHVCSHCREELEYLDMTRPTCHSEWRDLYDGSGIYGWLNEDDEIIEY